MGTVAFVAAVEAVGAFTVVAAFVSAAKAKARGYVPAKKLW